MATKESPGLEGRLERSCRDERGWLRTGPPAVGLERIEAYFQGRAYAPHRHDTYAIGYTIAGAQCFDYRGEARASLPGDVMCSIRTNCMTAAPVPRAASAIA